MFFLLGFMHADLLSLSAILPSDFVQYREIDIREEFCYAFLNGAFVRCFLIQACKQGPMFR